MKFRYIDIQNWLNDNEMFLEYSNKYFIDYKGNYYFKCYNTLLHRYVIVKCDKTFTIVEIILLNRKD